MSSALWTRRGSTLLRAASVVLAIAAAVWLTYQGWRLLFQGGLWGAVDLDHYHRFVGDWFSGQPIYADPNALHPPATYLFMWPLVGWLSFEAARWFLGATIVLALAVLIRVGIRLSGATTTHERVLIGLLFLGTYPTGASIGNGQISLHLLLVLMVLHDRMAAAGRPLNVLAIATLLCLGLIKPTFSVPFVLLVLIRPGGLAPVTLAAAGYVAATLAATAFRDESVLEVIRAWMAGGDFDQIGDTNLQGWLIAAGWGWAARPSALLVLVLLAAWLVRHRRSRLDLQFAVVAIVARLFTYHRWYDDVLLFVPMLVLFRVARSDDGPVARSFAGVLFGAALVFMLAPGGHFLLTPPWNRVYLAALVASWLAMLAFLVVRAESDRAGAGARQRSLAIGDTGR